MKVLKLYFEEMYEKKIGSENYYNLGIPITYI